MEHRQRSIRLGAAVLIFAVMVRLGGVLSSPPDGLPLAQPIHTIWQRWPVGGISAAAMQPDSQPTTVPATQPQPLPVFTGEDVSLVQFRYAAGCKYRPDLNKLMSQSLSWDLDNGEPAVLIIHTHGTEAYTQTADRSYASCGNYRTRDGDHNMIAIAELLKQRLEAAGIGVIHDRCLHDDPSYNGAYGSARASVEDYLQRYPSIQLVLDLHRDAATNADGSQYATSVTVQGQRLAQLMLVMGSDTKGLPYPNWQENLSVALKLLAQLERIAPGVTRTTTLRTSRYNQDLHSAMLLVEVGSAGNTLSQALGAAEILAEAIIALKDGANW